MLRPAALSLVLLGAACAGPTGPGPQEATFPPGERVARSDAASIELSGARYDLRRVIVQLSIDNLGEQPLTIDREGILLAYDGLEFPVDTQASAQLAAQTVVPPGAEVQLELSFVMEQALVEAATLQLLSIRRGTDGWADPLELVVPPPAAYVDAIEKARAAAAEE